MEPEVLLQKIDKIRIKYRGQKFDIEEGNPYIEESCELINQFKKEAKEEILILAKAMTEHLNQDERNEWFDIRLKQMNKNNKK